MNTSEHTDSISFKFNRQPITLFTPAQMLENVGKKFDGIVLPENAELVKIDRFNYSATIKINGKSYTARVHNYMGDYTTRIREKVEWKTDPGPEKLSLF